MKHDIPASVRAAVDERDDRFCRMCGAYAGTARQLHHAVFGGSARGMGGRRVHNVEEIVTLCLGCHGRAHADKDRWQGLLLKVITDWPGYTAMQLERWAKRSER